MYWFSPDNKFVLESLGYVPDFGYYMDQGPPLLAKIAIYDARNGKTLHIFKDVGSFNFPFWPKDNHSLLFQVRATPSTWKLERRDARTNTVLPLNFSNLGLPERWLTDLIFARGGKTMVALDETGNIWAEQLRPN